MPKQQPWWKRWLSYLIQFDEESQLSEHSEHLTVSYYKGRYLLQTPNAIYSFEDLYVNFRDAFRQMPLEDMQLQRVLLLGLGMGSIPLLLEKHFHQKLHYTAVEVDEVVLDFASQYGPLSDLESPIDLYCADAAAFVQQCEEQFDLIIVDIFIDDQVPAVFEQLPFLEQLRDLLTPDGLVLYNRLAAHSTAKVATERFYESRFKSVFPKASYFDVQGNWILSSDSKFS